MSHENGNISGVPKSHAQNPTSPSPSSPIARSSLRYLGSGPDGHDVDAARSSVRFGAVEGRDILVIADGNEVAC